MVPAGTELVPELNVVCVSGDPWRREVARRDEFNMTMITRRLVIVRAGLY